MTSVPENPPPADKGLPVQDPNGGPAAQPASSAPFPPAEGAAALPDRPSARTPPPAAHGLPRRGARSVPAASMNAGKFGMMFPGLPRLELNEQRAAQIAATMAEPALAATGWNTGGAPVEGDNPDISAGYTYIGQFLDHDITFDPSSSLTEQNDKDALRNYRTPRFDLDSLYGGGPDDSPYMYDQAVYGRLLTGQNPAAGDDGVPLEPADLPRTRLGRAVIGDPRNDVHVIIGQLHLAFLRIHNKVLDAVRAEPPFAGRDRAAFLDAQRRVRWTYQWLIVNDYLPKILDPAQHKARLDPAKGTVALTHYRPRRGQPPFIPLEFSGAAYRFGHSQVRQDYILNAALHPLPIFAPGAGRGTDLSGFKPLLNGWSVDWAVFFGPTAQRGRLIDTQLPASLTALPQTVHGGSSLAVANLLRGAAYRLPSGQAVAAALGLTPLTDDELALSDAGPAPLWFYVLREAAVQQAGLRLGAVGSVLVGEVLLGLLDRDKLGYLRQAPKWTPAVEPHWAGASVTTFGELLGYAGPVR